MIFDSAFKLDKQIGAVVKISCFQLGRISKMKQFLSFKDFDSVPYCTHLDQSDQISPLYHLLHRQAEEGTTPAFASLHQLPQVKVLLFAYKVLFVGPFVLLGSLNLLL